MDNVVHFPPKGNASDNLARGSFVSPEGNPHDLTKQDETDLLIKKTFEYIKEMFDSNQVQGFTMAILSKDGSFSSILGGFTQLEAIGALEMAKDGIKDCDLNCTTNFTDGDDA